MIHSFSPIPDHSPLLRGARSRSRFCAQYSRAIGARTVASPQPANGFFGSETKDSEIDGAHIT
jgi:hypothetical protein